MAIERITGFEPKLPDEQAQVWAVGYDRVFKIEEVKDDLGTYGIIWFEGRTKHGDLVFKMNALAVANVEYEKS